MLLFYQVCPSALLLYMKIAEYGEFKVGIKNKTDESFLLFDYKIMENLNVSTLEATSDFLDRLKVYKLLENQLWLAFQSQRLVLNKIYLVFIKKMICRNFKTLDNQVPLRKTQNWASKSLKVIKITIKIWEWEEEDNRCLVLSINSKSLAHFFCVRSSQESLTPIRRNIYPFKLRIITKTL